MRAILPTHALHIDQAEVGLVDQRGWLQAVAPPLAAHATARDPAQLLVDERNQAVEGSRIAPSPGEQQAGHVRGTTQNARILRLMRLFAARFRLQTRDGTRYAVS